MQIYKDKQNERKQGEGMLNKAHEKQQGLQPTILKQRVCGIALLW